MKRKSLLLLTIILTFALFVGCTNNATNNTQTANNTETTNNIEATDPVDTNETAGNDIPPIEGETGEEDEMDMEHSTSGEVPENLAEATDPTYPVGTQVNINTDHMPGMEGATGTIVGAYDTIAYEVSYDPTDGGERVENHKWVVREELEDVSEETLEPGTEVVIRTDHMSGMDGANGVIDAAEETTVYMIDYTPADGGEEVVNHKWVTESEISPQQ